MSAGRDSKEKESNARPDAVEDLQPGEESADVKGGRRPPGGGPVSWE